MRHNGGFRRLRLDMGDRHMHGAFNLGATLATVGAAAPRLILLGRDTATAARIGGKGQFRRFNPLNRVTGDFLADQLFNGLDQLAILGRGDGEGPPQLAGAAGTADAVNIIFRMMRRVEVEHVADIGNVDAAGRHVGTDQQVDAAGLERLQRFGAFGLHHVAMQGPGIKAMLDQRAMNNGDVLLAIAEDEGVLHIVGGNQAAQRLALVMLFHHQQMLGHGGGGAGRRADRHLFRVGQELVGQTLDLRRHGCAEKTGSGACAVTG